MVDIAFLHNTFRSSPLENLTMWRNFSTGHKRVLIPCCVCVGWWWRPGIIDVWSPLSVSLALTPTSMPSKPPDCFIFSKRGRNQNWSEPPKRSPGPVCFFLCYKRERERERSLDRWVCGKQVSMAHDYAVPTLDSCGHRKCGGGGNEEDSYMFPFFFRVVPSIFFYDGAFLICY